MKLSRLVTGELLDLNARVWVGDTGIDVPITVLLNMSVNKYIRRLPHQCLARLRTEKEYCFHQTPPDRHYCNQHADLPPGDQVTFPT